MGTVISRTAGRPRSDAATDTILSCALVLLAQHGYARMSTAEVAKAARASKATLYRRWPSKHALAAEAIRHALREANPATPDTGDVRADLTTVLEKLIGALSAGPLGPAIRAVISDAAYEPELSAALREVTTEARERGPMRPLLERARDQGLLAHDVSLDLLLDMTLGAPYFQLIVRQIAPSPALARDLVRQLLGTPETAT